MTAEQIIEEIKRLDRKDQLGVIRFAYQLDAERKLSGKELSSLAVRMTETDDPAEAAIIRESIVRGFNEVVAELPSLTVAERQQLVLRALELDDAGIPAEDLAVAEKRLAEGRTNPGSAVPLEEIKTRLRTRFAR